MSDASREEAEALYKEMLATDVALFTALGHYFTGIAQIHQAELQPPEDEGLKAAAGAIEAAIGQIEIVIAQEQRIFELAEPIDFSAYFDRRHEVISDSSQTFSDGLREMANDLAEGFYPAKACDALNGVVAQMTSNFQREAKIEGVLTLLEMQARRQDTDEKS